MPDKIDKELKRKFGAYLKVAILNAWFFHVFINSSFLPNDE